MPDAAVRRLALLSDVHANWQALDACLAHARAQGAEQIAVLGDSVGYGADPARVVERLIALAEAGAWVLRGNHDEAAVCPPERATEQGDLTARWTHERLSATQRAFLAGLPLAQPVGDLLLVHASAHTPAAWEYVHDGLKAQRCLDAARAHWQRQRVLVGHVHHQTLFYGGDGVAMMPFEPVAGVAIPLPVSRAFVATVGSVGQPRDGDPRAMYALYDGSERRLTFHRVAYDHALAAARVREVGLPEALALRLEAGR